MSVSCVTVSHKLTNGLQEKVTMLEVLLNILHLAFNYTPTASHPSLLFCSNSWPPFKNSWTHWSRSDAHDCQDTAIQWLWPEATAEHMTDLALLLVLAEFKRSFFCVVRL